MQSFVFIFQTSIPEMSQCDIKPLFFIIKTLSDNSSTVVFFAFTGMKPEGVCFSYNTGRQTSQGWLKSSFSTRSCYSAHTETITWHPYIYTLQKPFWKSSI